MWRLYAKQLDEFKLQEKGDKAVACLNHLITNALQHAPDVLEYMSRIRNKSVFNFCAIPQVKFLSLASLLIYRAIGYCLALQFGY